MANTYHQVHLQMVFAVKYRIAQIDPGWKADLFSVIGNIINEKNAKTLIVNGTRDHVHCLVGLKPVMAISELLKAVKARSSKYINDQKLTNEHFEWQDGYGVFSYHKSQVDDLFNYIQQQEIHHQKKPFLVEYRELLTSFGIDYDEQYIFREPV